MTDLFQFTHVFWNGTTNGSMTPSNSGARTIGLVN
jgi:hypothetical protein